MGLQIGNYTVSAGTGIAGSTITNNKTGDTYTTGFGQMPMKVGNVNDPNFDKGKYLSQGLFSDWLNAEELNDLDYQRSLRTQEKQYNMDKDYLDLMNKFNASEAQKDRDWQERMSNTSYQRMVEDLKKAGLNPILAYDNGGASTPQGATASSGQARTNSNNYRGLARANTAQFISTLLGLAGGLVTSVGSYVRNSTPVTK